MSILDSVSEKLALFAEEAVLIVQEEGKVLLGKVASDVSDVFEEMVERLGAKATELVANLFADDSLSGLAKANLAATQLVEHAAQTGVDIAAHDVTALIKSAYLAVKNEIASI